jgi:hypothetical protein
MIYALSLASLKAFVIIIQAMNERVAMLVMTFAHFLTSYWTGPLRLLVSD